MPWVVLGVFIWCGVDVLGRGLDGLVVWCFWLVGLDGCLVGC